MDYEKNNEALDIVKRMVADGQVSQEVAEKYFPELVESDNERIRKEIIEYIKTGTYHKDWIAWLEKQGTPAKLSEEEQNRFAKGVLTSCAMSFIDYLDAHKYEGKMCVSNGECEDIENAFHNAMWDRLHRYYCKYIEKQGEKESDPRYKYLKELLRADDIYQMAMNDAMVQEAKIKAIDALSKLEIGNLLELEKQGEQKPCMIQWKGDNLKEVIDFTGKDKNFEKWFKSFEEYEKYVGDHNGIFKLFNEDGSHYEVPVGAWIVKTPDGRNVASKAVFKQKPADKIEPKFHEGDIVKRKDNPHLTYILKRLTDDGDYEFHAIGKDGNEGCTCFAGVKYQDDWELVEQNPAWSEEDEKMLNSCIGAVGIADYYTLDDKQEIEVFLKSLKFRLLSPLIREFDEEEGSIIDHLIAICDDAMCYDTFAGCSKKDIEKYKTFLTNLKFGINPQPQTTWKPSEEQMKVLDAAVMHSHLTTAEYNGLVKLREQLKSL